MNKKTNRIQPVPSPHIPGAPTPKTVYIHAPIKRVFCGKELAAFRGDAFIESYISRDSFHHGFSEAFRRLGFRVTLDIRNSFLVPVRYQMIQPLLSRFVTLMHRLPLVGKFDKYLLGLTVAGRIRQNGAVLLFGELNNYLLPSALRRISRTGCTTAMWFGVWPHMIPKRSTVYRSTPVYDVILSGIDISDFLRREIGMQRFSYIGCAYNPQSLSKTELSDVDQRTFSCDVAFVGALGRAHNNRWKYLEAITRSGVSLKVWGYGVEQVPQGYAFTRNWQGWCDVKTLPKVVAGARINLNLNLNDYDRIPRGVNARTFEIAGCGGFQLACYTPNIKEYFEIDQEIVCFKTEVDLVEKIKRYLRDSDRRNRIAKQGFSRVQEYNYLTRTRQILRELSLDDD